MYLPHLLGTHAEALWLDFDSPLLLGAQLGLDVEKDEDRKLFEELIILATTVYSPHATAVMLSAEAGYDAIMVKDSRCGVAFCLEITLRESDPLSIPVLQQQFGTQHIRNNYAVAKLTLPFKPGEQEFATKLQLVAELADSCRYEGIDLILEPDLIGVRSLSPATIEDRQLLALRLLRSTADAMLLQYPGTPLGAATLTAELSVPWILRDLQPAQEYQEFKEIVRIVLENGAAGCAVGFQVLPTFARGAYDPSEAAAFVRGEGMDRVIELRRILEKGTATSTQ